LLDRRWAIAWLFFGLLAGVSGYFVYDENRLLAGAPTAPAVITDTGLFRIRGEAHILPYGISWPPLTSMIWPVT
jgi:hypothetical protein